MQTKMAPSAWKELVPQHDKDLLQWATALKVRRTAERCRLHADAAQVHGAADARWRTPAP